MSNLRCLRCSGQPISRFRGGQVTLEPGRRDVPERRMEAVCIVVPDVRRQLPHRLGAAGVLYQFSSVFTVPTHDSMNALSQQFATRSFHAPEYSAYPFGEGQVGVPEWPRHH